MFSLCRTSEVGDGDGDGDDVTRSNSYGYRNESVGDELIKWNVPLENKGVYLLLSDDVLDLELPVRGRT